MVHMLQRLLIPVCLSYCLLAASANAYCPPDIDYSVRGEFSRAEIVAVFRVIAATWLNDDRKPAKLHGQLMLGSIPGGFDPYLGAKYRVIPVHIFKGTTSAPLIIFSENTEARTPLRVGSRYVVFLERQTVSDEYRRVGDLMIDYCGNSSPLSRASPVIKELEKDHHRG